MVHSQTTSTVELCSSITRTRRRTESGRNRRWGKAALSSAFNSASRDKCAARPAPRSLSSPAVSWTGLVHVRAKLRQISHRSVLPHGKPARPRPYLRPEPADAFNAASGSRTSRQFRQSGPFSFPGSFSPSLAAPAAEPIYGCSALWKDGGFREATG